MDGSVSKERSQVILELREVLNHEDNALREKSLKQLLEDHPRLQGWIHDLVCKANFADSLDLWRLLDKFHVNNHVLHKCRTLYNPKAKKNRALLKKLKVTNTQICEQTWSFFNRHANIKFMGRATYRAWLRHLCKAFNMHAHRGGKVIRTHFSKHGKRGRE